MKMKSLTHIGAMLLLIPISACTQSGNTGSPAVALQTSSQSLAITEECKLLNNAMEAAAVEKGERDLQIVRGCPGFENVADTGSRFAGAASFSRAASVSLPLDAKATGPVATRIFQRMVSRNVPPKIAEQQTRTDQFLSAVNAARRA